MTKEAEIWGERLGKAMAQELKKLEERKMTKEQMDQLQTLIEKQNNILRLQQENASILKEIQEQIQKLVQESVNSKIAELKGSKK